VHEGAEVKEDENAVVPMYGMRIKEEDVVLEDKALAYGMDENGWF